MADVLFEKKERVAWITLNRPERRNAISVPMLEELASALLEAERDRDVRVVALTGAGRGFCSGLDLKDAAAGKATFVGILGVEQARDQANRLADQAIAHLSIFDAKADLLRAAARYIVDRRS